MMEFGAELSKSWLCREGIQEPGQVCWQNTGILDSYLKTQLHAALGSFALPL